MHNEMRGKGLAIQKHLSLNKNVIYCSLQVLKCIHWFHPPLFSPGDPAITSCPFVSTVISPLNLWREPPMSPRVNFKHILDTSKQTLLRISVMFEWSFTQGIVSLALLPSFFLPLFWTSNISAFFISIIWGMLEFVAYTNKHCYMLRGQLTRSNMVSGKISRYFLYLLKYS